jgi:hypothetical protein
MSSAGGERSLAGKATRPSAVRSKLSELFPWAVAVVGPSSSVSSHAKVPPTMLALPIVGKYPLALWEDTQIVEVPDDHQAR